MMYATVADMTARYPDKDLRELTDENGAAVSVPRIEQALGDASAEIDSYLMGRYTLPLSAVPAVLVKMCCTIAMYQLQSLRTGNEIEDVRNRYKDAIAYLTKVSTGVAQLGVDQAQATAAQTDGPIVVTAPKTFGRLNTRGF